MAMRGVTGDEHAPRLIAVGHRDAHVPEADMLESHIECEPGGAVQQA